MKDKELTTKDWVLGILAIIFLIWLFHSIGFTGISDVPRSDSL
jgi:hypothetical protein